MFNCHKVLFAVGLSVLPLFGFSSVAYAGWTEGTLQVVDSYLSPYDSGVHVNASVGMKMREWDLDTDSDDNPINGFYAKADIQVSQGNSEYGSTAYDGATASVIFKQTYTWTGSSSPTCIEVHDGGSYATLQANTGYGAVNFGVGNIQGNTSWSDIDTYTPEDDIFVLDGTVTAITAVYGSFTGSTYAHAIGHRAWNSYF